jgi:hypothetical protein
VVSENDQDSLFRSILDWIPVEVIGSYKVVEGAIPADYDGFRLWITILAVPVTFLWIAFATKPAGRKIAWRQALIAPFAFVIWTMAIAPEIIRLLFPSWEPWMGSVALGVGTVLLPIFDGILEALGVPQN